jgi:hypothetical protein
MKGGDTPAVTGFSFSLLKTNESPNSPANKRYSWTVMDRDDNFPFQNPILLVQKEQATKHRAQKDEKECRS